MYFFTQIGPLRQFLHTQLQKGESIGFVPTMGALHMGHLSLIKQSKEADSLVVCSIFVNPTQFNDPKDLERYPRTPDKDIEMLLSVGCDVIFMPEVAEIYPAKASPTTKIELGHLEEVMEGRFRPGHFAGVAQVVEQLLLIVQPQKIYMGQKDFQQVAVVRSLIRQLALPVTLVMSPTIREADGLAMSSRNVRLTPAHRSLAPLIYQTLLQAQDELKEAYSSPEQVAVKYMAVLAAAGFKPEYFEIVDAETLLPVTSSAAPRQMVACVAAWLGEVRLIDNLLLTI